MESNSLWVTALLSIIVINCLFLPFKRKPRENISETSIKTNNLTAKNCLVDNDLEFQDMVPGANEGSFQVSKYKYVNCTLIFTFMNDN